jgi:hypothetical protein
MVTRRPTRLAAISYRATAAGSFLGLALAAALVAAPATARAEDDNVPADTKLLRSILEGIGLQRDGASINYQERAPLVIPPSRTLPPPEKSDAVIANNPAWPKDPDVQRAKDEAARERTAIRGAGEQILHDESVLRPDQLTPGPKPRRTAGRAPTPGSSNVSNTYGYGEILSPSQLGYKGGIFGNIFNDRNDDVARFTGEPPRASLTEPPPGYQTPSPDQPYGLSAKDTAPKATDYLTTHGEAK